MDNNIEEQLQKISKDVSELYELKENYQISPTNRQQGVNSKIAEIISSLDPILEKESNLQNSQKALCYYLQGKTYNAAATYDKMAEQLLSKAIKLDPSLVDGWNSLGEVFWKKNDWTAAKNCFLGAMNEKGPNKSSLRSLSIVLRQLGASQKEKQSNVEESLKRAKEAVSLDVKDGESWYVLGNAYMTNFFTVSQDPNDLQSALKGYQQSESNNFNNPDLHFNRATIHRYMEHYEKAYQGFVTASKLDPSWHEPKDELYKLEAFAKDLPKHFKQDRSKLIKQIENLAAAIQLDTNLLNLKYSPFRSLEVGSNVGKIAIGAVVTVVQKDFLPLTVVLVDKDKTMVVASIYNIADKAIKKSDKLKLLEPTVYEVKSTSLSLEYKLVHVRYPKLLINDQSPDFFETAVVLNDVKTLDKQ